MGVDQLIDLFCDEADIVGFSIASLLRLPDSWCIVPGKADGLGIGGEYAVPIGDGIKLA